MTNRDKLSKMNNYELAAWLADANLNDKLSGLINTYCENRMCGLSKEECIIETGDDGCQHGTNADLIEIWLNSPAGKFREIPFE